MQLEYSVFWLFAIGIISVGSALLFYYKDRSMKNAPKFVRYLLATLRLLLLFFLGLLLLKPFVKLDRSEVQKPIFLCLHDNSRSILSSSTDTSFLKNGYKEAYLDLEKQISNAYSVDELVFGNTLRKQDSLTFTDSETDYSSLFGSLQELYSDENIGGVILATDGNHTRGEALAYAARRLQTSAPIYTIVLGDSVKKADVKIAGLQYNERAYVNKTSQVLADIQWNGIAHCSLRLKLWANDSLVSTKDISVRSNSGQRNEILNFTPLKTGIFAMRLEIDGSSEDKILENNKRTFYVTALASKKKIVFFPKHITPDAGAFYRALQNNSNYDLHRARHISNVDPVKCDMLVFFGDDKDGAVSDFVAKFAVPMLWVRENSAVVPSEYTTSVAFKGTGHSFNSVSINKNNSFNSFAFDEGIVDLADQSMPIQVPFGDYVVRDPRTQVVAYQKIKGIETSHPLITVLHTNKTKQVHLLGSGYWHWRMQCFIANGNFFVFDNIANIMAEYLLANVGKKRFVVQHPKVVSESEQLRFVAQVMDQSLQLTANADVSLTLSKDGEKGTMYSFTPGSDSYTLTVGHVSPGVYNFRAEARLDDDVLKESGVVQVTESNDELLFSSADLLAITMLYDEHEGNIYTDNDFEKLIQDISNAPAKSVYVFNTEFLEFIDLYWFFSILCTLLFAEWIFRKYYGGF